MSAYLQQDGHGFTVVVIPRPEDLADNAKEIARRLLELEYLGAQVIAAENPSDDLLAETVGLWRQRRGREQLSARTMETLRGKALRGYGLGKTPFGYAIGAQGRLEIVPEEAKVVEEIYRLYLEEGMGLRLIARHLNSTSVGTRRGSRWSVVTVRDILRNRAYTGTYVRFGIRIPSSHPAIVSSEVFRQAQQKREQPTTQRADQRETAFALSGLAYCGACQGRMIGVSRRQSWARKRDGGKTVTEYRYYRCGSRVNQSVCSYHTWRADVLEEHVLQDLAEKLSGSHPNGDSPSTDIRATLHNRLRNLDARFQRYLNAAARGDLSLQDFRGTAMPLTEEVQYLEQRLEAIQQYPDRASQHDVWRLLQRQTLNLLQERWANLTAQQKLRYFSELLQKVVVFDDHVELVLEG
jgi:site-specific DNA recombinase